MIAILDFIRSKKGFPKVSNVNFELNKLGVIRIILGLIVFVRQYQIYDAAAYIQPDLQPFLLGSLIVSFCFTIGLLTPLMTPLLLLATRYGDIYGGTGTLGTDILAIALFTMWLINSSAYSVDGWVTTRWPRGWLSNIYGWFRARTARDIERAYLFGIILYALISFFALVLHFNDPYWQKGLTLQALLTNTYLCSAAPFFRGLEADYPTLFYLFSIAGVVLQAVFQLLMIPLLLFRWGGKFVFWWGLQFFLISLFFINLSYLPHIEILLWLAIFTRKLPFRAAPKSDAETLPDREVILVRWYYKVFAVLVVVFIAFQSIYGWREKELAEDSFPMKIKWNLVKVGLNVPNVFNQTDLSMGDRWVTMYRLSENAKELLPMIAENGERINYTNTNWTLFSNHNSDLLYFRNSLSVRRRLMSWDSLTRDQFISDLNLLGTLRERVMYDYHTQGLTGTVTYEVVAWESNSSDVVPWESNSERHTPQQKFSANLTFDGHSARFE